jgi:hypothetical protein
MIPLEVVGPWSIFAAEGDEMMERLLSVWWQVGKLTKRASGEVFRRISRYIRFLHGGAA